VLFVLDIKWLIFAVETTAQSKEWDGSSVVAVSIDLAADETHT